MSKYKVSLVRYEKPGESVRKAVELVGGIDGLKTGDTVFIKPNIVFWSKNVVLPPWGVITTSRVMEDMVALLKDAGAARVIIGEGTVVSDPKDTETAAHAHRSLGYHALAKRYGVEVVDVFQRPFVEVELEAGEKLSYNQDAVEADLVVTAPVMKTHAQTVVSLGLKNLKGLINIASRKRCHNADLTKNLTWWVSRLATPFKNVFSIIDGIYTAERGPSFDAKVHRSNLLVASNDLLSGDLVGAHLLIQNPALAPYLAMAAMNADRPADLSQIEVVGEKLADLAKPHGYTFPYNEDGTLPAPMAKMGIEGLAYHKYDDTLCTYCSGINGLVLTAIAMAYKGQPFGNVEVLTGKRMSPSGTAEKSILLGKCMSAAHKDNPAIKEALAVAGCPPKNEKVVEALHKAGVMVDPSLFENRDALLAMFMKRYEGRPEFDLNLFKVA